MAYSAEAFVGGLEDDGFYTPEIKQHSIEKIRLHNYYVALFTTSMKSRWPQRAYLGLYSGSGRARIEATGEIIETTALSALRPRFPFTHHIFVDSDPRCIEALRGRIAALPGDRNVKLIQAEVGESVPQIVEAMPAWGPGNGLLSFCFIDPFSAALNFDVIKVLGRRYRMDFLILLMLGRDVRTNFRRYLEDPNDTRIASLIDDPDWREEWRQGGYRPRDLVRFLLERFDDAMTRLGYEAARPTDAHPIHVIGKKVFLYSLVLYSKDKLGNQFWQAARQISDPQTKLDL